MAGANRAWIAILILGVLGSAQALTSASYENTGTLTLSLAGSADIPVKLAPGPEGATTVSASQTGAKSSVTGGGTDTPYNTTFVNNSVGTDQRVRLSLVSSSGPTAQCATCSLELRRAAQTSAQITILSGSVTQSQGPWESINATGNPGSTWHLYAVAKRTGQANNLVTVRYLLEVANASTDSPLVAYHNMTMEFTV